MPLTLDGDAYELLHQAPSGEVFHWWYLLVGVGLFGVCVVLMSVIDWLRQRGRRP